jgi:hypothetical protein
MADDLTAAAAAAAAAAASTLELKLPEGFDAKAPELVEFKKLAADSKLDGKVAQSLFDFHHKTLTGTVAKSVEALTKKSNDEAAASRAATLKQWSDAAAAMPEQAKLEVQRYQVKYLDQEPEARALLEKSGLLNHPAMQKLFARHGKDLAEDTIANAAASAAGKQRGPAVLHGFTAEELKAMYPQSAPMWAPKGS